MSFKCPLFLMIICFWENRVGLSFYPWATHTYCRCSFNKNSNKIPLLEFVALQEPSQQKKQMQGIESTFFSCYFCLQVVSPTEKK